MIKKQQGPCVGDYGSEEESNAIARRRLVSKGFKAEPKKGFKRLD